MTTPQSQLCRLYDRVRALAESFEGDEGEESIFEKIDCIFHEIPAIRKKIDMLQDQLTLITRILNKSE